MNRKNESAPKGPAPRRQAPSPPVKATKNWNKEKDWKVRKDRERRAREEQKAIANKPARQKRWKELYETGSLDEDGLDLPDGNDLWSDENPEESTV